METTAHQVWEADLLGFSQPVLEEYRKALPALGHLLGEADRARWAEAGAHLGRAAFRAWPAAVEYFRASPLVAERLGPGRLAAWAARGEALLGASADLAVAYFRASPGALPRLSEAEAERWAGDAARLHGGGWQSSALAAKYFDHSPRLLACLSSDELAALSALLVKLAGSSYPLALACLDAAAAGLPLLRPGEHGAAIATAAALGQRQPRLVREWFAGAAAVLGQAAPGGRVALLTVAAAIAAGLAEGADALKAVRRAATALAPLNAVAQHLALQQAAPLAGVSPEAAVALLESAGRLFDRLDPDEFDRWVAEGRDLLRAQPAAGAAYFALESGQAVAALRRHSRGIELGQVAELLRLYAKALSGRDVAVMPTGELTTRGVGWTAEERPTTEGEAVYLPGLQQGYATQQENFDCLKVCATHQVAHLEFGSFEFRFDRPARHFSDRRAAVAAAAAGNGHRPLTDIERFFDLFADRRMAMDVFTVLEDARLDSRLAREYGGIRRALARVQRDAARQRPPVRTLPLQTAVLEALLQRSLDPGRSPDLPARAHTAFARACAYLARLQDAGAAVEDSAEATLRVYDLLAGLSVTEEAEQWVPVAPGEPVDLEALEDAWSLHSSGGQSVGSAFTGNQDDPGQYLPLPEVPYRGDFKPQLVQTLMKLKDLQSKGDRFSGPASAADLKGLLDKLGETEIGELMIDDTDVSTGLFATNLLREAGQEGTPGSGTARSQKGVLTGAALRAGGAREYTYDEWDFRASGYRHRWCLLKEQLLEQGDPAYFDETLHRHARMAREVQRQFQLLKPELFRKIKNLPEGEEYDLDALVEAQVDRRAGRASSEKLYWRRNKDQRSVAMAFLLDVSASTDEDVVKDREPPEPWRDWDDDPRAYMVFLRERMAQREQIKKQRRRIIDVEKESAVLLIHALETLGDAYGVYGFSGYGRDNVEVFVVKDLAEPFGEPVKGRLDKLEPVRGTRMGAAIRHATAKLDAWDARLKVLLLLSDGRPQDHDYGRDRTEKEYALQDTRKALLEARQKQIVPFALTVDREGHDYLKTICEGIGYEVVDDIESLPARLPALYRQLTG